VRLGVRELRPPGDAEIVTAIPAALTHCLGDEPAGDLGGALGLVWVHEWLALTAEHVRARRVPCADAA
jgi:hypothetical protein